jgi:hypothetical protein
MSDAREIGNRVTHPEQHAAGMRASAGKTQFKYGYIVRLEKQEASTNVMHT